MAGEKKPPRKRNPNTEELEAIGRGEAWFAKIDREYEQHSEIMLQSARDQAKLTNRLTSDAVSHAKRMDVIAERALNKSITADGERDERINLHNTATVENMNQQNDAAFLLLARSLADGEEVTVTISKKKTTK